MAGGTKRTRIRPLKSPKIDQVRNEINVTPLVDVCLVLLIIFMVITPMLARGKEVPLPMTKHHASEKDQLQPIVAIDASGQVYFDKQRVEKLSDLGQHIENAWSALELQAAQTGGEVPERKVFLKGARELRYKKVYEVVMALHDLGIPSVDLGTNESKETGK